MHGSTVGFHQEIQSAAPRPTTNATCLVPGVSTATQITSTSTPFETATFYGYKATSATAAPTNNGAAIYIGQKDAGGTLKFLVSIAAGASWSPVNVLGSKLDLMNFYVLTPTTTDGVAWSYQP